MKMSVLTRKDREICWAAKDEYWKCLDDNNNEVNLCLKLREEFKKNCPKTWVKHFDRKREYDRYKESADQENWEIIGGKSKPL